MRNTTKILKSINLMVLVWMCSSSAQAQVFGGRSLQQPSPGLNNIPGTNNFMGGTSVSASTAGSLIPVPQQGTDRFLRTSRPGRDFVGRNRADIKSFIGTQQALAVGQVRPATEGLKINSGAATKKINQPIPAQPAKGMYYPKLVLDVSQDESNSTSEIQSSRSNLLPGVLDPKLIERIQRLAGSAVQLSLTGNKVTISGQATSARTAELAVQVLQFEPGVDEIDNQLK